MAAIIICSDFEAPPQKITPKSLQVVTAAMTLKHAHSLEEKL